jgi:hypothetical protein
MMVFGVGCLNVCTDVRAVRRQPKHRGHRHRRPGWDNTSAAAAGWDGTVVKTRSSAIHGTASSCSAARSGQAPKPRSGAPKAQGLTATARAEQRSLEP